MISNNTIHNNGTSGSVGAGIVLASGTGNQAFNNVIWSNNGGIYAEYGSINSVIYNNTIYANNADTSSRYGIYLGTGDGSSGSIVKNNIIYLNTDGDLVTNSQSGAVVSNNLVSTNPNFVNAASHDFHLTSASPAIGAGANLYNQGITTDLDRNPRPKVGAFDEGAYQYIAP